MRCIATTLLLALLCYASGCAAYGNKRPVKVQSDPAGADVYVDEQHRGTTPITVMVSSWDPHRFFA